MNAQIITIGTELLLGQIVDTNSVFIAQRLAEMGIDLYHKSSVGDNRERIKEVLSRAREQADLVITTGGLGPTSDDITSEMIGEVWGQELVRKEEAEKHLKSFFEDIGAEMAPANEKQTYFPRDSETIPNPNGTALGMILEDEKSIAVALPGPSQEMEPMVENQVLPYLEEKISQEKGGNQVIRSRILRLCGIGESTLQGMVADLLDRENPTVAPLAKTGEVHLRITAKGRAAAVEEMIAQTEEELRERVGEFIYGVDEESLEQRVGEMLRARGLSLSLAESCSGGFLAHNVTNVPGSSDYFDRGLVTYSNRAKRELLGVSGETLAKHGAVSREVAEEMALGLLERSDTDLSVATTGIAGPGGGTEEKPVGLVYVALADEDGVSSEKFLFHGNRAGNKERTLKSALGILYRHLRES